MTCNRSLARDTGELSDDIPQHYSRLLMRLAHVLQHVVLAHPLRRVAAKVATRVRATHRVVVDMAAASTDGSGEGEVLLHRRGCRGLGSAVVM